MMKRPDVVETLITAEQILICPTVSGELLAGFKSGSREHDNRLTWEQFLDNSATKEVGIDTETAEFYAEIFRNLRAKGTPIPTNDMWIAACAFQQGVPVYTLDAHFRQIDGLLLVPV